MRVRQGKVTVREYADKFRSLAVESSWNDNALITAFQNGLSREICREVALREELGSIDKAIKLAIRISDHVTQ